MAQRKDRNLLLSIVVKGSPKGNPLCDVNGIVTQGNAVVRRIDYSGPITSTDQLANTLATLFTDPAGG